MKISTAFPTKYISAEDLDSKSWIMTISGVNVETIGESDTKPVVHFANAQKGFPLNKTNARQISTILGADETDAWVGRQIELFPTTTEFKGDIVTCIRVRPAPVPGNMQQVQAGNVAQPTLAQPFVPLQQAPAPAGMPSGPLPDDEIPF